MDALLPAFLAALIAEFGDKTQLLAIALGLHFRRFWPVLCGVMLAAIANAAIAGAGGYLVSPLLTFEAATLMLALALVFAGTGALIAQKPPEPVRSWRLPAFPASFLAFFLLELGDKTQFLTFAIAARSGLPVLAASGAAAGVIVASALAMLAARDFGTALPAWRVRMAIGIFFLLTGIWAALAALRLI